jgi:hypothetical protein
MTRRERLESKVEKRREWAQGRNAKASALLSRNEPYRGDYAFNTQPGHIPERARVIAREDRAIEHLQMAQHHEQRAAGLEHQLDRAVFDDDPDAVDRLEARIAGLEETLARMKAVNAAIKAEKKANPAADESAILIGLARAGTVTEDEAKTLARVYGLCPYQGLGYSSYAIAGIRARIRKDRARIDEVKRKAAAQAEAEAAPGGVVITRYPEHDFCRVRFAQKPSRAILDALKAAQFYWRGGVWAGKTSDLPPCVIALVAS